MEANIICERCSNFSGSLSYLFSCNHSLCSQCVVRIIAFHHIQAITTQDQIQIACPCQLGTKLITLSDIPQLLEKLNLLTTCFKHGAAARFQCFDCEVWLCDECIELHKLLTSHHQLAQSGFKKCEIHEGMLKDYYCHDCHEIICPVCSSLEGAKHSTHNYQFIKDYAKELKTHIPLCDVSAQVKKIEVLQRDFRAQVGCVLKTTTQKMDELIQLLQDYHMSYNEKMKEILQRGDLFLHLLKFCYLEFSKINATLDIHLLQDLSEWNLKVHQLELTTKTEQKLKMFHEDIKEYYKIQPVENILIQLDFLKTEHEYGILRDWTKATLTLTGHKFAVRSLIQLKDGRIASGSDDKTIKIWEVQDKEFKNTLTLTRHDDAVRSLIQLKDGRIASGSWDKTVKIWEMKEKEIKNTLTLFGHNDYVLSLIQLKDGRLASGSGDTTIKIWEMKEKEFKNTLTLTGHDWAICSLIQLKDERIASGSDDKTIKIWEVQEKEFKNTLILTGHDWAVLSLIQMKDGRIASGSYDKTIKIWELKGKEIKNTLTLIGHNGEVDSLIQLKDGRIASGSVDKTIKIWEVKKKEIKNTLTLIGHDGWVCSLIQMKDGGIASGSEDKTIKIWRKPSANKW